MDAYEIMSEWDRASGRPPRTREEFDAQVPAEPRSDEELDRDVPATLADYEYEDWKARIEAGNVKAIKAGMEVWGLPIEPLKPFELDDAIETHERTYWPHSQN